MNKKIITIISVAFTIILIAIVLVFITLSKNKKVEEVEIIPTPSPSRVYNGTIIVKAEVVVNPSTSKEIIELRLKPEKGETLELTAFSIKASLSNIKMKEVFDEKDYLIVPDPTFAKQKWNFPIQKLSKDGNGNLIIEYSGYHLGQEAYKVTGEMVIAKITIPELIVDNKIKLTLSEEDTRFWGEGVIKEIKALTE